MDTYQGYAGDRLIEIFRQLYNVQKKLDWWPAQSPIEVVVGAVLAQGTVWKNAEKAMANLAEARLIPRRFDENSELMPPQSVSGHVLLALSEDELSQLIRPAGFYRQKARKLKAVLEYFSEICSFDFEWLAKSKAHTTDDLRRGLLALSGIGPETADSILLYALSRPTVVADAYTMRLLERHSLLPPMEHLKSSAARYEAVRGMLLASLPKNLPLYRDLHAQIVEACKTWCVKKSPKCPDCPLGKGLWNWQYRSPRP